MDNKSNITDKFIFLVDYQFNNAKINGLDIIRSIKNNCQKILVTSHYNDVNITDAAEKLHIKILPKYYISHIELH